MITCIVVCRLALFSINHSRVTSFKILIAAFGGINLRPAVAFSVIRDKCISSFGIIFTASSNSGLIELDALSV